MIKNKLKRKRIAYTLLFIIFLQVLQPITAYALTSGPSQPETSSFQPVSVSDMVNLSSGDFHYNLPLLDIDGYPINLSYQGGSGIDDEASWVGLGWSLNIGSINRQLRGVPDDFLADESIIEHETKPKVTIGGKGSLKFEFKGLPVKPNLSLTMGIFNDSYTGVGAEIGANAGISFGFANEGALTAGMGLGVLSNTSSGVDFSPYVNLALREKINSMVSTSAGLSASLGFNTRSGMKSLTLGSSFSVQGNMPKIIRDEDKNITGIKERQGQSNYSLLSSNISFNTEPINPRINIPYTSKYSSFSFDIGTTAFLGFAGAGATGYKSIKEVSEIVNKRKSFGFLYAELGKNNKDAVMDFVREKDNAVIPDMPNLPIAVPTYDLFSFTNQFASGQFRIHKGGTGSFFDNSTQDISKVTTSGVDIGVGAIFHGGITHFDQTTVNRGNKWVEGNAFVSNYDFLDYNQNKPAKEQSYFKMVGEKTVYQNDFFSNNDKQPVSVSTAMQYANNGFANSASINNDGVDRHYRKTDISYLTAKEAQNRFNNNYITTYPFLGLNFNPSVSSSKDGEESIERVNNNAKQHHISEIKITDEVGKKMIYGLPIYNLVQNEYTFAIGTNYEKVKNQVNLSLQGNSVSYKDKGVDGYYNCEKQAPYATSYLLTQILSPDYVDVTNNGVTDDDLGTAIKFNYSKISNYKWRTPFPSQSQVNNAILNRSSLADDEDDKGSIIYGEKEIGYIQSIETKNKIAYFITEDREDGLGVLSWLGGRNENVKQKRLKEIRLYSKYDLSKPIKVVVLNYDYLLCTNTPNSVASNGGKLTLNNLYFTYGNTTKGSDFKYKFEYHNAPYDLMSTDRWGVYKPENQNQYGLTNEEFPYSVQNKDLADQNVQAWNLKKITLPTGGAINIEYEADNYSYVQDKKASRMFMISELLTNEGAVLAHTTENFVNNIKYARGLRIILDKPTPIQNRGSEQTAWFKANYLNNSDYLYNKMSVDFSNDNYSDAPAYDFVSSYQKINRVNVSSDGTFVDVYFPTETQADVSAFPISFAAWHKLKNEYPKFAYPGYKNRVSANDEGKALKAAISALANSFKNLSDLTENFFKKAARKNYADKVNLNKSWVRLVPQSQVKFGGGHRVKQIVLEDKWEEIAGGTNATYGQKYEYTLDENPETSSGVASYEPSIGSDENSLRQPIKYSQKVKGGRGIDNLFELEEPFGESLYPAPSVVYSKVKIIPLDRNQNSAAQKIGYDVEEYYTAKDFPVRVKSTLINQFWYKPKKNFSFISSNSVEYLVLSQGYSVSVNDMHGKIKSKKTFNSGDVEISSTSYEYGMNSAGDGTFDINNDFKVISPQGVISNQQIGIESEFFTDFRENVNDNQGRSITLGADVIPFITGAIPIPHKPTNGNSEYKLFRSASALKITQSFGVVKAITTTQEGSKIRMEHLAYDQTTSEPILTRTQNEFRDYIYNFKMPAYWTYAGMGGAYQNSNTTFKGLGININSSGKIVNGVDYTNYLQEGDQLIDLVTPNKRYWLINNNTGGKSLINDNGQIIKGPIYVKAKIVESGFKNKLGDQTYAFTSRENPLDNINFFSSLSNTNLKIINASSQTFNQEWVGDVDCIENSIYENYDFLFHKPYISTYYQNNSFGTGGIAFPSGSSYQYSGTGGSNITESFTSWNYSLNTNHPLYKRVLSKGIWLQSPIPTHLNETIGFTETVSITSGGSYLIGCGGDNYFKLKIIKSDGTFKEFLLYPGATGPYINYWHMFQINLDEDVYTIDVEAINYALPSDAPYEDNEEHNPGVIGLEIYQNSIGLHAGYEQPNVVWSTVNLANNPSINSFRTINGIRVYNNQRKVLNPFTSGLLGAWRPYQSFSYLVDREDLKSNNEPVQRNSGFFKEFDPFWQYSNGQWNKTAITNNGRWKLNNTITQYDKYGQELENLNPLDKYSSAIFSFKGELPSAVASNSRSREIFYNGFEDAEYVQNTSTLICNPLYQKPLVNLYNILNKPHTGNYSYLLNTSEPDLEIANGKIHQTNHQSTRYYDFNNSGEYILKADRTLYPNGFEPSTKKYHISMWVKDYFLGGSFLTNNKNENLKAVLTIENTSQDILLKYKASVEGWKLMEADFTINNTGDYSLKLKPLNGINSLVDDIRIAPHDALLKSYAYNERTFKLMAEMDENNFATFYEYDDEGSLTRVKKETERGIVTIKESRSAYRKSN